MATGKLVPDVAKDCGYTKTAFYRVIRKDRTSPTIRNLISEITGLSTEALWPEAAEKGKEN